MPASRRTRRAAAAALAMLGLAGLGLAAAAQLEIAPTTLQAGSDVVATCQPEGQPIRVEPLVQLSGSGYSLTHLRVSGLADDCEGLEIKARLLRVDGTTIGNEFVGEIPFGLPGSFDVPVSYLSGTAISAADFGGVSVVIFGSR